jgi:hypothetical protein
MSQENVEILRRAFEAFARLREGKVVTMRDYSTRAEALEAAGLSE